MNRILKLEDWLLEREANLPGLVSEVCEWMEGGGTLKEWSRLNKVRYRDVLDLASAPTYRREFEKASEVRKAYVSDVFSEELLSLASADVRRLFDEDGNLKSPHQWDKALGSQVKSVKYGKYGLEVAFWEKNTALKTLGGALGIIKAPRSDELSVLEKVLEQREENRKMIEGGGDVDNG